MRVVIGLFVLGCILQSLDAALEGEKLPFEVDRNSGTDFGNVAPDKKASAGNKLTAQAAKQGENFVASPKPPNAQGFSFDAEPEPIAPPPKPTKTPAVSSTSTNTNSGAMAASGVPNENSTGHSFWPHFLFGGSAPFGLDIPFSKMNPFSSDFHPFGKSNTFSSGFPFEESDSFSSDFPFAEPDPFGSDLLFDKSNLSGFDYPPSDNLYPAGPAFPLSDYDFQIPAVPSMSDSLSDMRLVEDRVLDDEHAKGRFQTYKSKDGNAMIQIMHRRERRRARNPANAEKFRSRGKRHLLRHPHFLRRDY